MSRVDVVVPCYKYAHFLRGCVQSVLSQEGVDVRVLIIDDCSPDNTAEVGRALAAEDKRVELRRHEVNKGHIATYNEGLLEWASGDYCVLLSADDMLTQGSLGRAARLMDANPTIVMTYGHGIWTATPEREARPIEREYGSQVFTGEQFIERLCAEGGNLVTTPTAVVRTSVQKEVGGYRKDLPHSGDMEMWLRLATRGAIGFIDAYQAFYRTHDENMYLGFAGVGDLRQRAAAFDALFGESGRRIADADRLRALASRSLAWGAFWSGSRCFDRGEIATARECCEFAAALFPKIRGSKAWWKFKCKRLLGPRLWSAVGPLAAKLRGRRPVTRHAIA